MREMLIIKTIQTLTFFFRAVVLELQAEILLAASSSYFLHSENVFLQVFKAAANLFASSENLHVLAA